MFKTLTIYLFLGLGLISMTFGQWTSLGNDIIPDNYHSNDIKIAPDGSIWDISGVNAFPPTGTNPVVNRSADGGATWTTTTVTGIPDAWPWAISPIDSLHAWMACDAQGLYHSANGGLTWTQNSGIPFNVPEVHFFDADSGWALAYDPTDFIIRYCVTADGGQSWTVINTGSSSNPPGTSVPPFDSTEIQGYYNWVTTTGAATTDDIIVIGTNKGYLMSKDRGYNWTRHTSPLNSLNYLPINIVVKDTNTVMIVSDVDTTFAFKTSTISLTTRDGGQTWTDNYPDVSVSMTTYVPGTAGTCLLGGLVSTGKSAGTAITYDMGQNWYTIDQTTSIGTIDFLNDSIGYAASANGPFGLDNNGQVFQWSFDCVVTSSAASVSACDSYVWPINGQTYTEAGSYVDTIQSSFGCDSILTLNLTFTAPDTSITRNGDTFIASDIPSPTTHQWLRCDQDYAPIPGATVTILTAIESGQYAVAFTNGDCVDTSGCFTVCLAVEDSIVDMGDSLMVASTEATYQWLDCDNGNAPIADATAASFVPGSSGTYAVVLTSAIGCVDTLACVSYVSTELRELRASDITLFPNPAEDRVALLLPTSLHMQPVQVQLLDMQGRMLQQMGGTYPAGRMELSLRDLSSGMYLLRILTTDQTVSKRLMKQ